MPCAGRSPARRRRVETRRAKGRHNGKEQSRQQRDPRREREHAGIRRQVEHHRRARGGDVRDEHPRRQVGEPDAAQPGEGREHEPLDQHLAHEPDRLAPRASRTANSPGARPRAPAQVPRVRAGDEQDDADDAHQDAKRRRELRAQVGEPGGGRT